MEIRFNTNKPIIEDFIDRNDDVIDLIGWSYDGPEEVTIKNWKFINYKASVITVRIDKWVHLNKITFVDCTFKDVNFVGAVPMDKSKFRRCSFENCILTDHIRWNTFDNCSFNFCLFSGYFHGNTFKKSCTYENVLFEFYGGDSFFNGKKRTNKDYLLFKEDILSKNTKSRIEILKYFYPNEMNIFEKYVIGNTYYIKKPVQRECLSINFPKSKNVIINNEEYYSDIIKGSSIKLAHYKPEIRIQGSKYHIEIEDCKYKM